MSQNEKKITESYQPSNDGTTIGLIDSLITISHVLRKQLRGYFQRFEKRYQNDKEGNYLFSEDIIAALADLHENEDLLYVLQTGRYNGNVVSKRDRKLIDAIDNTNNLINGGDGQPLKFELGWINCKRRNPAISNMYLLVFKHFDEIDRQIIQYSKQSKRWLFEQSGYDKSAEPLFWSELLPIPKDLD